eukprot:17472-Heterococcus_DN1.PRE.2
MSEGCATALSLNKLKTHNCQTAARTSTTTVQHIPFRIHDTVKSWEKGSKEKRLVLFPDSQSADQQSELDERLLKLKIAKLQVAEHARNRVWLLSEERCKQAQLQYHTYKQSFISSTVVLWGAAIHTDHDHVQQSAAGAMPVPLRLLSDKERLNVPAKQGLLSRWHAKQEQAAAAETSSSSRQTEHAGEWHFQAEHKLVVCLSKCALSGILLTTSAGSSV